MSKKLRISRNFYRPEQWSAYYANVVKGLANKRVYVNLAECNDSADLNSVYAALFNSGFFSGPPAYPVAFFTRYRSEITIKSASTLDQVLTFMSFTTRYDINTADFGQITRGAETFTDTQNLIRKCFNLQGTSGFTLDYNFPLSTDPRVISFANQFLRIRTWTRRLRAGASMVMRYNQGNRYIQPLIVNGIRGSVASVNGLRTAWKQLCVLVDGGVALPGSGQLTGSTLTPINAGAPCISFAVKESYKAWFAVEPELPAVVFNDYAVTDTGTHVYDERTGMSITETVG